MAYFNGYPATYQNPYQQSFIYQQPQQMPQMQQIPQVPQVQGTQMPPANQPQQPAGPIQSGILWVSSEQEAQAYPVAPNNAVALWDSSAPAVYIKQADASGKPVLKVYDLTERAETPRSAPIPQGDISTLKKEINGEIESLWAAVREIREKTESKRGTKRTEADHDPE